MANFLVVKGFYESYGIECSMKVYPNNYFDVSSKTENEEIILCGGFLNNFEFKFMDGVIRIRIRGSAVENDLSDPIKISGIQPADVLTFHKRIKKI